MYDFLHLAKRNVWFGLVAFLVVFAGLGYLAVSSEATYRARTLILFTLGREYVYVPETDQGGGVKAPNPGDFQGVVNAEMLLLDDPVLRSEAIEAVGLERAYPDIAAVTFEDAEIVPSPEEAAQMRVNMAVGALRNATSVSVITGSYVVSVAVSHFDPVIAAELANALTDAYFNKRRRIYAEREIRTLRERLDASQEQADDLARDISLLLDGRNPVVFENEFEGALRSHAEFEAALATTRVELSTLEESRRAVEAQLDVVEPEVVQYQDYSPDPVRQNRVEQLSTLETEYASAVARLGGSHPNALALQDQIQRARDALTEQAGEVVSGRRVGPNPAYTTLDRERIEATVEIEKAERRIDDLEDAVDKAAAQIVEFSKVMPELSLLKQGQEDQAQRIVSLQSRLRESEALFKTAERDNVRVIQAAVPAMDATSMPTRTKLAIAAFVAGLAALAVMLLLPLLARRPARSGADPAPPAAAPSPMEAHRYRRADMRTVGE